MNTKWLAVALCFLFLLSFGCLDMFKTFSPPTNYSANQTQQNTVDQPTNQVPITNGRVIVDANSDQQQTQNPQGSVANSQVDCATLTPNCGSCVAKVGCGWCKSSNSCLFGNQNGPEVGSCQSADWAYNQQSCNIAASGKTCSGQTNCASCLSGSGCHWCITGSRCADSDVADSCGGGWLSNLYQCNYASR